MQIHGSSCRTRSLESRCYGCFEDTRVGTHWTTFELPFFFSLSLRIPISGPWALVIHAMALLLDGAAAFVSWGVTLTFNMLRACGTAMVSTFVATPLLPGRLTTEGMRARCRHDAFRSHVSGRTQPHNVDRSLEAAQRWLERVSLEKTNRHHRKVCRV